MTVTEVSVDSSYFTTAAAGNDLGFTTGSSIPYVAIQVADGDTVTVDYLDASPPGLRSDSAVWYALPPSTATPGPTSTASPTMTETPSPTPTCFGGEYFEDFESGAPGWVADGLWHLTDSDSYSPSHCMWYGDEFSGNYDTGGSNSGSLTSPPLLLTGDFVLTYRSREETEGTALWDTRKVKISTDGGGNWADLHQSFDNDHAWYGVGPFDLSAYTGEIVRIRFIFDTVDDSDNDYTGWLVDDIAIGAPPPPIPSMNSLGLGLLVLLFALLLAAALRQQRTTELREV